jgi:hypothetical protein
MLVLACKERSATTTPAVEGGATTPTRVDSSLVLDAAAQAPEVTPESVVTRWDAAHAAHDATDRGDSWCENRNGPTDEVIAPFKISAKAAGAHLLRSSYAKQFPSGGARSVTVYKCPDPAQCSPGVVGPPFGKDEYHPQPGHSCFYLIRLEVYDPGIAVVGGSPYQHLSGGEWVDAFTNTLWFYDVNTSTGWESER